MAMFTTEGSLDQGLVNDINMTPLIDVMLVLLIIFIVTLPVLHHAVKLELPRATSQPQEAKPDAINVDIRADGTVLWNDVPLDEAGLASRIAEAARRQPVPSMQLHADRSVRYEHVADLLSAAQRGGLSKINFVTEPKQ